MSQQLLLVYPDSFGLKCPGCTILTVFIGTILLCQYKVVPMKTQLVLWMILWMFQCCEHHEEDAFYFHCTGMKAEISETKTICMATYHKNQVSFFCVCKFGELALWIWVGIVYTTAEKIKLTLFWVWRFNLDLGIKYDQMLWPSSADGVCSVDITKKPQKNERSGPYGRI